MILTDLGEKILNDVLVKELGLVFDDSGYLDDIEKLKFPSEIPFLPDDLCGREDVQMPENASSNVLGQYIPMRSPGRILLFSNSLRDFYRHVLQNVDYTRLEIFNMTGKVHKSSLIALCLLVIMKTFLHECFHFYIDINNVVDRQKININKLDEEALAVAYSCIYLEKHALRRSFIFGDGLRFRSPFDFGDLTAIVPCKAVPEEESETRINSASDVFVEFVRVAYKYTQPGYRDWVHFDDLDKLRQKLINVSNELTILNNNGVRLDYLITRQLDCMAKVGLPITELK